MEKVAGIEEADGMEKRGGTAGGTITIITATMPCILINIDLRSIFRNVGIGRNYRVRP